MKTLLDLEIQFHSETGKVPSKRLQNPGEGKNPKEFQEWCLDRLLQLINEKEKEEEAVLFVKYEINEFKESSIFFPKI